MHPMVAGPIIVLTVIAIAACADPTGPGRTIVGDPTVIAHLGRERPTVPGFPPDSVGIPPSIPPVYEEVPPELGIPK
jgi:hypothetical protein